MAKALCLDLWYKMLSSDTTLVCRRRNGHGRKACLVRTSVIIYKMLCPLFHKDNHCRSGLVEAREECKYLGSLLSDSQEL